MNSGKCLKTLSGKAGKKTERVEKEPITSKKEITPKKGKTENRSETKKTSRIKAIETKERNKNHKQHKVTEADGEVKEALEKPEDLQSILLESPSCTEHRVSFDTSPKVKEIARKTEKAGKERKVIKFEVKDKSIIMNKKLQSLVKTKAKKFYALVPSSSNIILKYRRMEDLEADLRALGLKPKTYIENKLIVNNFSFKETEESVKEFFKQFAGVEKVSLEKNTRGFCTGKGIVTFSTGFYAGQENKLYDMRLNGRLLRIERIKKQCVNRTRLFISHMRKSLKIAELRNILKKEGFSPKNVRIDLRDGRNLGYGFVEFQTVEEAESFLKNYSKLQESIGSESFVELSKEKQLDKRT
ncbi:hypothetical protein GINT2_001716 [Glugoides intestinalis]